MSTLPENPSASSPPPELEGLSRRIKTLAEEAERLRSQLRGRTRWLGGALVLLAALTLTPLGSMLPWQRHRTVEAEEVVADRFRVRSPWGNPGGAAVLGRGRGEGNDS